jgi:hypothetical protein
MRWQMAHASAVTSFAEKASMQMTVSALSKKSLLAPFTRICIVSGVSAHDDEPSRSKRRQHHPG